MSRRTLRLSLVCGAAIALAPPARVMAQEPPRAATVADASAAINLETFPVPDGAIVSGARRLASLSYVVKGEIRAAYGYVKKGLEAKGWKELPNASLTDQSCSGSFGKNGYTLSLTTNPGYVPETQGKIEVRIMNHGNVDATKLPVPTGTKLLYSFPSTTVYVTSAPAKETGEALAKLLKAKGWEPYGTAGETQFFKKNAVELSAYTSVAPGQDGKTVIQFGTIVMSVDLPAPPSLVRAQYADTTKALSFDTQLKPEAVADFYRETLAKSGWKASTSKLTKDSFMQVMYFLNPAKDLLKLEVHTTEGITRGNLNHMTAAEVAEQIRLANEKDAKQKAENEKQEKMAAKAAAKERVTVAIAVPTAAKDVEQTKDKVEFKLASGKGRAAAEAIRDDLVKKGWKKDVSSLQGPAGTVVMSKAKGTLTITYIDTGVMDAEVSVVAFTVEFEVPEEK